jgi:TPP-dependent indolepyruvate ferredoxin oxidoreductase alpha subunit
MAGVSAVGLPFAGYSGDWVEMVTGAEAAPSGPCTEVGTAVAQALIDAACEVVTNVPATAASTLFASWHERCGTSPVYSFNEEPAYTMAHAAALVGKRSAVIFKSHGLAKAANSVVDSLPAGTTAGFVPIVLSDPTGAHSDSVFDLEAFLQGLKIHYRKPSTGNVHREVLEAFKQSESLQLPVAVFIDSQQLAEDASCPDQTLPPPEVQYQRDAARHILCPLLAPYQHRVLQAKRAGRDPAAVPKPQLPRIPDDLPPKWQPTARRYQPLFDIFKELRVEGDFVSGDTGIATLFAFPPYDCIDVTTYYGGSTALAAGARLAGRERAWAVSGDYAFVAAGHLGLVEAMALDVPIKVLIANNGVAQATGGQPIAPGSLETVLSAYQPYVRTIENTQDRAGIRRVLAEADAADELRIVVAEY